MSARVRRHRLDGIDVPIGGNATLRVSLGLAHPGQPLEVRLELGFGEEEGWTPSEKRLRLPAGALGALREALDQLERAAGEA